MSSTVIGESKTSRCQHNLPCSLVGGGGGGGGGGGLLYIRLTMILYNIICIVGVAYQW